MTPYSAFLLVKGEISRLAGHLRSPPSRGIMLQRGSYLSANMVSVFGTEYIQDLIMGGDSKENCRPNSDTTGVKYIISLGGLCAIQFLSIDWESDWIGKIPSVDCTWYGIIREAVSTLWYGYSELNYTAISLAKPFSKRQVVWDQLDFPSTLLDL
ncbi:hypothetical protein BKA61DRAFT_515826, partial [Leptodontidium sp. MPI-SDFR-AT-0119]